MFLKFLIGKKGQRDAQSGFHPKIFPRIYEFLFQSLTQLLLNFEIHYNLLKFIKNFHTFWYTFLLHMKIKKIMTPWRLLMVSVKILQKKRNAFKLINVEMEFIINICYFVFTKSFKFVNLNKILICIYFASMESIYEYLLNKIIVYFSSIRSHSSHRR